jgi:hypothetical protein
MLTHAGLPKGWPKPTLCGRNGRRARCSFIEEEVTCKLCQRVIDTVDSFDEPRGFVE